MKEQTHRPGTIITSDYVRTGVSRLVICIATKVNDASIHLFRVIGGFAGGHEVLSLDKFETWKQTVIWGPGNVLSYSECAEGECQLCRIVRRTGRLPFPKVVLVDRLKDAKGIEISKDSNRPGVLYLVKNDKEKA